MQPLLKKKNLDPSVISNFRPISKLLFWVLERAGFNQLLTFLDDFSIYEKLQSGSKHHHSTEIALLRILNDLLLTVDSQRSAVSVLLDLTSAFDTINHTIVMILLQPLLPLFPPFSVGSWSVSVFTCLFGSLCHLSLMSLSLSLSLALLLSLLHLPAFHLLITAVSVSCSNQLKSTHLFSTSPPAIWALCFHSIPAGSGTHMPS